MKNRNIIIPMLGISLLVLGCQSAAMTPTSIHDGHRGVTDKGFPPDSWVFQNDGAGSAG